MQMVTMSRMSPLAFSVLTPIVKALVIVSCAILFGDTFTIWSGAGVMISSGGGYLFSRAVSADRAVDAKKAGHT